MVESRQDLPTVPDFEIVRRIGVGGFSTVYEAIDHQVTARVALKVLRVDLSDGRGRERFEREGRTMGRLRDVAGIVSVYRTTYTEDGRPVIVMAYCQGGSLADRLRADGPLDADRVELLGKQIAAALAVAHSHGIFHRDIKPENILETQSGHYALSDFGIAAVDGYRGSTETASTLTPPHAPPERFVEMDGQEPSGAAGDIYSLGSTLYMLLTGRPPFGTVRDGGIAALANRVMNDPPAPIDRDGVSPAMAAAIAKALAKDPRDRFVDAQAFADAFSAQANVAEPEPIAAPAAPSFPEPFVDVTEPARTVAAPVVRVPTDEDRSVKGQPTPPVPATELFKGSPRPSGNRKSRRPMIVAGVVVVCAALIGALVVVRSGDDASSKKPEVAGVSEVRFPTEDQGPVKAQRDWQFASKDGTELVGSVTATRVVAPDQRGAALVEFIPTELAEDATKIDWSIKPSKINVVRAVSAAPGKAAGLGTTGAIVRFALPNGQDKLTVTYRVVTPSGSAGADRINDFNIAREAFKLAACKRHPKECGPIPVLDSIAFWPGLPLVGIGQVVPTNPLLFGTNADRSLVMPGKVTGVTWSVGEPAVAQVDSEGQVTGVGEGFVHVRATIEGLLPAEIVVAVTRDKVPVVAKLNVTGPTDVVDGRADGQPARYSANPVDKAGKAVPGAVVSWNVSPSSAGTVDVQGSFASLLAPSQMVRAVISASVLNAEGDRVTDSLSVTVSATDHPPADRDRDGIPDAQESCPDAPGLAQFGGCPDSDSDGTPEPPDSCPGVRGLIQFGGCPDVDNDGVPEPPDVCPGVRGLTQFAGCPDSDGDGVPEPPDACPGLKGSLPNGCNALPQGPDLVITAFSATQEGPAGCMRFHVTIKNRGDSATPSGVKHGVLFSVNGSGSSHVWSDTFYGPMAAGEPKSLDTNGGRGGATCNPGGGATTSPLWPGVSGQSYSIQVWVDNATDDGFKEYGHIKESDEKNNIWDRTFNVP